MQEKIDVLKMLKVAPVLFKYIGKYYDDLVKVWYILKPMITEITNDLKEQAEKEKNGEPRHS